MSGNGHALAALPSLPLVDLARYGPEVGAEVDVWGRWADELLGEVGHLLEVVELSSGER